ncbi:hypothetical protein F5877DRAFT_7734, partial [Lentinula edodes]
LNISEITECEPVFVSFRGHFNTSLQQVPISLQILPFNSTPSLIPLPSYAANSTGVNVTFLPIPANTEFVATLVSPSGSSISSVSDVFEVSTSSPQNTACIPQNTFIPAYKILNPANFSQCENFTVNYSGRSPPVVELFNPRGSAYPLDLTSFSNNTATYNLAAIRQSQVMLNFISTDGGQNQTIQGDAFSSTSCFPTSNHTDQNNSKSKSDTGKSSGISKGTIIGLSVGLGVIVILAIPMVWLVIRERRRRRQIATRIE